MLAFNPGQIVALAKTGSDRDMTPEQEISRRAQLVSAAKALLSLQIGLAVGAFRIRKVLSWLGDDYRREHPLFDFFIANIPADIPLGSARLLWRAEIMLESDDRLVRIETKFRRALLSECVRIIDRYDTITRLE
jgi:hypothetical protein